MTCKHRTPVLALLLLAAASGSAGAAGTSTPSDAPAFEPAPMPNHDLYAPVQRASEEPKFSPTVFKPSTQFSGDGLLPGSNSQGYEERHMLPGYGVNLSVPLK